MNFERPILNNEEAPKEENSQEQNPEPKKPRYFVGVGRNPDGSPDFSKAMSFEPGEKRRAEMQESSEEKKAQRARMLEIPAEVRSGTGSKVWYSLRNAIFINKEMREKAENQREGRPVLETMQEERKIAGRIGKFQMQQSILDNLLRREGNNPNTVITEALIDSLEKNFIDEYEKLKTEGAKFAFDGGGHTEPLDELLESAKSLRSKLVEEMSSIEASQAPEQQPKDIKAIKATVALSKKMLEDGLNRTLPLSNLRLKEDDFERWQKLADGLENIRRRYTKDSRMRSVKNAEYEKEVSEMLGKI